ncbi:MAG: hypothetical protein RLZZ45_1300 [Bacteroidota bacterium]|jgi:N-acetylneuraminate lyase
MNFPKINGLVAAPFTPMHPDGSINVSIIPTYHDFLKRNGVAGVFICGSTGEGPSMTLAEKKAVAEAWAQANRGDDQFKLIMFLGGTCLEDAKELARHASAIGLNGISITAPNYFKPSSLHQLAACCIEVAEAATDQPFYYYHIPVLTGVRFSMIELMKLLHGKLKNFAGIKFTDEDIADYTQCIHFENGQYEILWGRDECLLAAMAVGGRSGIGSTYNYAMPLYKKLIAAYDKGDMKAAANHQLQSIEMISLLGKYGGLATGKVFMKAVGIDCGKFRLPVANMLDEQYHLFQDDLKKIGFDQLKSI